MIEQLKYLMYEFYSLIEAFDALLIAVLITPLATLTVVSVFDVYWFWAMIIFNVLCLWRPLAVLFVFPFSVYGGYLLVSQRVILNTFIAG